MIKIKTAKGAAHMEKCITVILTTESHEAWWWKAGIQLDIEGNKFLKEIPPQGSSNTLQQNKMQSWIHFKTTALSKVQQNMKKTKEALLTPTANNIFTDRTKSPQEKFHTRKTLWSNSIWQVRSRLGSF